MYRRHFLALMTAAALAGCGPAASESPVAESQPAPPAGAELVVLKLPGMT
jgi:hypothetical protein